MNWLIEFIFPRRLHRLNYFIRVIITDVAAYFLYSCGSTINPVYLWTFILLHVVYTLFFICLPRTRDIGMNGWWLLILFVPFANIWFGVILLFRAPRWMSEKRPDDLPAPASAAP